MILRGQPHLMMATLRFNRAAWAKYVAVLAIVVVLGFIGWQRMSSGSSAPQQTVSGRTFWGMPNLAAAKPIPMVITGRTATGAAFHLRLTTKRNGFFNLSLPVGRYWVSVPGLPPSDSIEGSPFTVTRRPAHPILTIK